MPPDQSKRKFFIPVKIDTKGLDVLGPPGKAPNFCLAARVSNGICQGWAEHSLAGEDEICGQGRVGRGKDENPRGRAN